MGKHQLLQINGVTKRFIGVTAVDHVDMVVYKGELLSLIGPNGSGKTTLFNCITGFLKPEEGQIFFKENDITSNRPDRITLNGISRTFQNVRLFSELTVMENLLLSLQQFQEENFLSRILQTSRIRRFESEGEDREGDTANSKESKTNNQRKQPH